MTSRDYFSATSGLLYFKPEDRMRHWWKNGHTHTTHHSTTDKNALKQRNLQNLDLLNKIAEAAAHAMEDVETGEEAEEGGPKDHSAISM